MQRFPGKKELNPRRRKWMNPRRKEKRMQATPPVDSTTGSTCGRTAQIIERIEGRHSRETQEEALGAELSSSNNMVEVEDPTAEEEDSKAIRGEDIEEASIPTVVVKRVLPVEL